MNTTPALDGSVIRRNTQQRLRRFVFTVNNYTEEEYEALKTFAKTTQWFIMGKERGEQGTPHIQGYINLKKKERMTALVKMIGFKGASFRPARNEEALIKYCQKDNCEFTLGFPKPIKIIQELATRYTLTN